MAVTILRYTLDKVRFSCSYSTKSPKNLYKQCFGVANGLVEDGFLKKGKHCGDYKVAFYRRLIGLPFIAPLEDKPSKKKDFPYLWITFSTTKGSKGVIGFEIVPRKMCVEDWGDFRYILTLFLNNGAKTLINLYKLAEIELACDVRVPFNEIACCIAPGVTTINDTYHKKNTLYLGSQKGRCTYVVYDKKKHLKEKKGITLDKDLTRVEVQLRHGGKYIDQMSQIQDPFKKLLVVRKAQLKQLQNKVKQGSQLDSFITKVLSDTGVAQEAYLSIPSSTRATIVKRLRPYAINFNGKAYGWAGWFEKQQEFIKMNLLKEFIGKKLLKGEVCN